MKVLRGSNKVTDLVVGNGACQFPDVTAFDLSVYPRLETLSIGNRSMTEVGELKVIGLSELKSVIIGMNSFMKMDSSGDEHNGRFYLKNCPKLKSLMIGPYSFSDYSVIEIENVNALEVIEMGDLNENSYNFRYASLELKSILIHRE